MVSLYSPPSSVPANIVSAVLAVYAAYTAQSQLKTFKARCVSRPQDHASSNNTVVDKAAENGSLSSSSSKGDSRMAEKILTIDPAAIKLETLEVLARGANFDLRNACVSLCDLECIYA